MVKARNERFEFQLVIIYSLDVLINELAAKGKNCASYKIFLIHPFNVVNKTGLILYNV